MLKVDPEVGTMNAAVLRSVLERESTAIAVLEQTPDQADFKFVFVNTAYQAIKPSEPMLGKLFSEVWPEAEPLLLPRYLSVAETGTEWIEHDHPFDVEDESGESRTRNFSWQISRLETPDATLVLAALINTTPEVEARTPADADGRENAAAARIAQLDEASEQAQLLAGANRILAAVINAETEDELGVVCLDVVESITGSAFGFIAELADEGRLVDISISDPGWAACQIRDPSGHRERSVEFAVAGLYGHVIESGEAYWTNDPSGSEHSMGTPKGHPPLEAFLGVPLQEGAHTIGVIAVANRPGGYGEEQARVLGALAPAITSAMRDKRTKDHLARTTQLLEAHIQNSPLAVIEFDTGFHVIRWSEEAEHVFGYSSDEIIGRAIGDMRWVFEEDIPLVEVEMARLFEWVPRSKNVNRNYRKDGSVIWCEWYSSAIYDDKGQMASVLSLVLDITERKRAEDAERRELERTQVMLETASVLATATVLEDVLAALCDTVLQSIDHTRVSANLWSQDGSALVTAASKGKDPVPTGLTVALKELTEPSRRAIAEKRSVLIDYETMEERERGAARQVASRLALAVPLMYRDRVVGLLAIDDVEERCDFTPRELAIVEGIAAQAAVAIENARLYEVEHESARLGRALAEVDATVHSSLEFSEVTRRALAEGAKAIGAKMGAIHGVEDDEWVVWHDYGYEPSIVGKRFDMDQNRQSAIAVRTGEVLAVDDVTADSRVNREFTTEYGIRSCIVAPLIVRGEPLAALFYNYGSELHHFTDAEIDFVSRLASSLSLAAENARLYESQRGIAETLQETLVVLPTRVPGVAFSRSYESATFEQGRVGGDFVDVFEVHGHLVGITLGDVSGKGIDAAVTTSLIRTTLRVHSLDGQPPACVVEKANEVMRRFTESDSFVTLWFGLLNTKSGVLRYVCAGHPPPLVLSAAGEIRELDCRDAIVGAFEGASFSECQTVLVTGDRLILYSDGVTEARSPEGVFLDPSGLHEVVARRRDVPTPQLSDAIMGDVIAFSEGVLRDDAAVLTLEAVKLRHREETDSGQLQAFPDDEIEGAAPR